MKLHKNLKTQIQQKEHRKENNSNVKASRLHTKRKSKKSIKKIDLKTEIPKKIIN